MQITPPSHQFTQRH